MTSRSRHGALGRPGVRGEGAGDPRTGPVWALAGVVALALAVAWATGAVPSEAPERVRISWVLLAGLFAATELLYADIVIGRHAQGLSLTEIPLVLGLLLTTPQELLLARLVGTGAALLLVQRQRPLMLFVNLTGAALQTTLAVVVTRALDPDASSLEPHSWVAVLLGTTVAVVALAVLLSVVIALQGGHEPALGLARTLPLAVLVTLVVTCTGLLTVRQVDVQSAALLLLAPLVLAVVLVFRSQHALRQRHERLESLHHFTRAVDSALQDESVPDTVVAQAKELLRADGGALVVQDPSFQRVTGDAAIVAGPWWSRALEGRPVLRPRNRAHPGDGVADGYRDGLSVPVRAGGTVTGALVVAGRVDRVSTFDEHDLQLLESLAGQAGIALRNADLVRRIRTAAAERERAALTDALTGLPNRASFTAQVDGAAASGGRPLVVVLLDIDRFGEVNAALGHDVGDQVLVAVARRVRALVSEPAPVARVGSDEFAVALPWVEGENPEGAVFGVLAALAAALDLGDYELPVSATAGYAMCPDDGSSGAELLRHAEIALHQAKFAQRQTRRYQAADEEAGPRRLALAADVARAVVRGELEVHYQPQAGAHDRRVRAFEALLRWQHPVWGRVPPDEFIPLAERTGVIGGLTDFVLRSALHDLAGWREHGRDLAVAVNVSARSLSDDGFVHLVHHALTQARVPAEALVLEITESSLMADADRAMKVLRGLVDLGVTLSVDDFGTGYSSLAQLRRLPVSEVKVDRSFVQHLESSRADAAVVRAVTQMARALGLRVVAEGVESEQAWEVLETLDCDLVQGWALARPMPGAQVEGWLREH
ncbi:GGDEF domain-containing protein [Motilibacter sp. K478]|nr:GGDEF domain-containing protein [Motilibacter aurantiacus]